MILLSFYFVKPLVNEWPRYQTNLWFRGCNIYKKIPPATETLRDSNCPDIGILTSSQTSLDVSESPLPSLPKTKHNGSSTKESTSFWLNHDTCFNSSLLLGWPAKIFIWNLFLIDSKWSQLPETIGSWHEAPRLALNAFSLNGSQHPGSRKAPPCLHRYQLSIHFFSFWSVQQHSK